MPSLSEIFRALYGAYRLARFDRNGMQFFDVTVSGFWKSFFAAVIVAPVYLLVLQQQFQMGASEGTLAHFLAIHMLGYVIVWVLFALVMVTVSHAIDRDHRYIGFIVAYNWASVLQHALYLPAVILVQAGTIRPDAGVFLLMVLFTVITVYFWFVAKTALDITGPAAAGVVLLDFVLGIVVQGFANSLA